MSTMSSINAFKACEKAQMKHIDTVDDTPVFNQYEHAGLQESPCNTLGSNLVYH